MLALLLGLIMGITQKFTLMPAHAAKQFAIAIDDCGIAIRDAAG